MNRPVVVTAGASGMEIGPAGSKQKRGHRVLPVEIAAGDILCDQGTPKARRPRPYPDADDRQQAPAPRPHPVVKDFHPVEIGRYDKAAEAAP